MMDTPIPNHFPYAGWQVAPNNSGWGLWDSGIVAASLAFEGLALRPHEVTQALAPLPGHWHWDSHEEILTAQLPPLPQDQVAELIGQALQALQTQARSHPYPANPLLADAMAREILQGPTSPLEEAAWHHYFTGNYQDPALRRATKDGLETLLAGQGAQAASLWYPWIRRIGIGPFHRLLQSIYKTERRYDLAIPTLDTCRQIWLQQPDLPESALVLVEYLLYFGLADQVAALLAQSPSPLLDPARASLTHLRQRPPATCRTSFLLITWNRPTALAHSLDALLASRAWDDTEWVIGVNGSEDPGLAVLAERGLTPALVAPENRSIDLYRDLFPLARGEVLIELDDDLLAVPPALDALLYEALVAFPDYGAVGLQPRLRLQNGSLQDVASVRLETETRGGQTLHRGSLWGCCLALRREDFWDCHGFYGAALDKRLGEEDQLMRKLHLRQRKFGHLETPRLEISL